MLGFRKRQSSIEGVLRFRLLLSLLIVLGITLVLINVFSRELTRNYVLSRLEHDAESLIAALEPDTSGKLVLEGLRIPNIYRRAFSGHYYQITLPDQVLRSRSLWDLELPSQLLNKTLIPPDTLIEDQLLLTLKMDVRLNGQAVSVWIAEDIHPLAHDTRRFNLSVMLFLLIAFALLWWLQGRSLRQSFRFFEQLRQRVQSLHQGNTESTGFSPPREIKPLSDEINRLVDQLGQRTERSRNALGNFAHELKRPLQQLNIQKKELTEEQQQKMTEALNQIQYLLDRELKRARIAGRCLPGQTFFPLEDLPPLIEVLKRIYPDINFTCDMPTPHKLTDGINIDRDDLLELLGNLLDNAAKYAVGQVKLTLKYQPDNSQPDVILIIEDDGTGVSEESRKQLTERGNKLDESVAGHGLGLSICQSIVQSYQGELKFDHSALGGLKVTAFLKS
ncbi:sensor histidine kinase [Oceanospirillum sanctuarii]|uniref:sensor histidine kinase n=1 Tax=Oceanospirillum sanctuarii TaxID=1434821 RepID=UPI001593AD49|nr:sensor histidine kinase [Oceanospirillum sanctuarii]